METPQIPIRLKAETTTSEKTGVQQTLFKGWSEFYPEELEPVDKKQEKAQVTSWWHHWRQ